MKIAIVNGIYFPEPGGAQTQSHNIANKFYDLGKKIDCYVFNPTNLKNNFYNIIVFNKLITSVVFASYYYFNFDISFFLEVYLKKIIKVKKYDVWHFNHLNFKSLIIIKVLKKLNQKVLVTFQGADIQIEKKINYGYRIDKKYDDFLKKIIKKIDGFASISENIKNDLLSIGVNKKKIFYVPNAIEIKKFQNFKNKKTKKNKILKFITVARFAEKKKGYDLVGRFTKELIKNKINFRWTIIGSGTTALFDDKYIESNKQYFRIIENIDNIEEKYFPHSTLIKYYKESDLYINLARIESFGISFIESLASGVPVITFNKKGANEIIINNFNGFKINSNKIKDFIKKIKFIYKNKIILRKMRNNSKNSAKQYDLTLVTKKLFKVYKIKRNKINE